LILGLVDAAKGGDYSYPHSTVFEDRLYIIVALADLKP